MMAEQREFSAADILDWNRAESPVIRVRIPRDTVPGGLSLAMAPMFVKWQSSSPGFGPDDHYIVQNVNIVNNPVGGVVLLATLKVLAASVESIEFVAVTTRIRNRDTPFGHAMLRFIFKEDRAPHDPRPGRTAARQRLRSLRSGAQLGGVASPRRIVQPGQGPSSRHLRVDATMSGRRGSLSHRFAARPAVALLHDQAARCGARARRDVVLVLRLRRRSRAPDRVAPDWPAPSSAV